MWRRLQYWLREARERLWFRPLIVCVASLAGVILAMGMDRLVETFPILSWMSALDISSESLIELLSIMASSMLVFAIFSVTSMLSAYSAAAGSATPRSFPLVLADDTSQNALSTFVGSFIFSVIALIAVQNGYLEQAGRLFLFLLTLGMLGAVVLTFIYWVDRVARLGRMSTTIQMVERATWKAMKYYLDHPRLDGASVESTGGMPVFSKQVGYVQSVDTGALQTWAEARKARLRVAALPGAFVSLQRPLVHLVSVETAVHAQELELLVQAFRIGEQRVFDHDPRLGLCVLCEIGSRALSPAVNDPGTAIEVIGRLVRLLTKWGMQKNQIESNQKDVSRDSEANTFDTSKGMARGLHDRIEVPEFAAADLLDDAFGPLERDGAGLVEVGVRLQKAFQALRALPDPELRAAIAHHHERAWELAAFELNLPQDLAAIKVILDESRGELTNHQGEGEGFGD